MHIASIGSGSHSPFPIHVVVLGPVSTSPGGQLKFTLDPSSAGFLSSIVSTEVLAAVSGILHLAIII